MRVSAVDVAHRFPGTDILFEHLSFTARPGEVIALCGPSGCGKSTLLSILAGWVKPWSGHIEREDVGRIGWVFQNPYGVANRTALDHVVFPLLAKGMTRRAAETEGMKALELFGLTDAADRRFAELSGGEAQRLMLARAVCTHPDMLLVDEPTAQLDMRTAETVSHVLGNLAGQGMIVFVATHDPRTRDACDRVIDLSDYAPPDDEDVPVEADGQRIAQQGIAEPGTVKQENVARPQSVRETATVKRPLDIEARMLENSTPDAPSDVVSDKKAATPRQDDNPADTHTDINNGVEPQSVRRANTPSLTFPDLDDVWRAPRHMRFVSICSEVHRNLTLNVSHAIVFLLVALCLTLLLAGYDAMTVVGLQNQAVTRVSTLADVRDLMGGTVSGTACDRLAVAAPDAVRESGAIRSADALTPTATPRQEVPVYEVSDGFIRFIADSQRGTATVADPSGVWVSRALADLFGLEKDSILPTDRGTLTIAGVYDWPNDGRDTRLAFAFVVPVSADGAFTECWAEQWPYDDQLDALLYTTAIATPDGSNVGVLAMNNSYGDWDAEASYQTRMTRLVPWLGLAVGVVCGAVSVLRRRLEYAGALHAGQSKGAQLLGIALETVVWAGLAALCACALLAGLCVRIAPADAWLIAVQSMRAPVALFAGAVVSAVLTGLLIRESRLFRYFKNR